MVALSSYVLLSNSIVMVLQNTHFGIAMYLANPEKSGLRSNLKFYLIYEKEITFIRQAHDKLMMPAGENL